MFIYLPFDNSSKTFRRLHSFTLHIDVYLLNIFQAGENVIIHYSIFNNCI